MERTIKIFCLILISIFAINPTFADNIQPAQQQMNPQLVTLPQCIKTFNVGFERLFCLTEVAISSYNFTIDEIQSDGGYILFSVAQYKFLATIFAFGENKAILKITPCDNNYNFPPIMIRKIFSYIEANQYKKY